jgi:hypothetical protein
LNGSKNWKKPILDSESNAAAIIGYQVGVGWCVKGNVEKTFLHLTNRWICKNDDELCRWPVLLQKGMTIQVGEDEQPKRLSVYFNYYTNVQERIVSVEEEDEEEEKNCKEEIIIDLKRK